jgi:hypothetical protein
MGDAIDCGVWKVLGFSEGFRAPFCNLGLRFSEYDQVS